ncbi:MAG: hypothetical protein ACLS49_04665 [Christensenellales bacterium]
MLNTNGFFVMFFLIISFMLIKLKIIIAPQIKKIDIFTNLTTSAVVAAYSSHTISTNTSPIPQRCRIPAMQYTIIDNNNSINTSHFPASAIVRNIQA